MSSEWPQVTLGDLLTLQRGMDLPVQNRRMGPYPVVASTGIIGFHDEGPVNGPGVLIGRSGSIGGGQYIAEDFWPLNTTLWVKDFKGNDARFCYYLLKSIDFSALNAGSGVPTLNRNHLHPLMVASPPIEEQREISLTLGSIDDRITLLRETNTTLEAIAQALFKSWFVDFDPVRAKMEGRVPEGMDEATAALFPDSFEESELGLVPTGWAVKKLDEISDVGIGKTPPRKEPEWFSESGEDVPWVSIRDMGSSGVYIANTNECLVAQAVDRFNVRRVPNNTVLLSFKLTVGRVSITDGEMTTNEAIAHCKLDPEDPLSTEFIYLYLKRFNFGSLGSTSSIAEAVNSKTIKSIPIIVPSNEVVFAFHSLVSGIFQRLKENERQAETLANLRDTLLPRLISGQLRVSDVESMQEDF